MLAALASLVATPALAQESRASALAKLDAEFAASDTNKDGALSRAEVEARMARMKAGKAGLKPQQAKGLAAMWFARTDADGDGKVTRAESQATMRAVFDRYDLNGDGKVDGAEAAQARAAAKAGK